MTYEQAVLAVAEESRILKQRGAINIHLAPRYVEEYGYVVDGHYDLPEDDSIWGPILVELGTGGRR